MASRNQAALSDFGHTLLRRGLQYFYILFGSPGSIPCGDGSSSSQPLRRGGLAACGTRAAGGRAGSAHRRAHEYRLR